ncbi:MAG: hypothetical protein HN443_01065 [Flavobacteriaceae bacterium]|nr:hypothetical protein [Flavobacteriaceae bacterium]
MEPFQEKYYNFDEDIGVYKRDLEDLVKQQFLITPRRIGPLHRLISFGQALFFFPISQPKTDYFYDVPFSKYEVKDLKQ